MLDFGPGLIPATAEATVSGLDLTGWLSAGQCLAGLLGDIGNDLEEHHRALLPAAMAR